MRRNRAQATVQQFAWTLRDGGASFDDVMQVVIAPFLLTDIPLIRKCGLHSGIPRCCTEHFITKALPELVKGERLSQDDAGYIRCPACRRSDRRVSLKRCNCFYFMDLTPQERASRHVTRPKR